MRIVIDMQGAQSVGSRHRGIGRYTLALAQALVRNRGEHDIFLALNGLFQDSIEIIRAAFDGLLPQDHIRVWYAPGSVNYLSVDNNWRRQTAELIREAFLMSLNPDMILVSSLFEGLGDNAVTSIGKLSNLHPTAAILYDLIPYIYRDHYLENPITESWYLNKLDHLRRSNLLVSISESSREEAIQHLGFDQQAVYNISTAADTHFSRREVSIEREAEIRTEYNLSRPFVMYTGGIDFRKNIEGLIRAYASLPRNIRNTHQLAIVCSIQPPDSLRLKELAQQMGLEAHELVLTGFVPEDVLVELYNLCKIFVFPSLHEGFGLPALEAMSCGRAVIGSNTSSIPEVIGRKDALFDPYNDEAIAEKIKQVLTDDSFRQELERHSLEQAKHFSWDQTAQRAIEAFEHWQEEKGTQVGLVSRPGSSPKLAYISPLPPARSGISDYSAELLPELSRYYDIDVIVTQETVSDPWINENCNIHNVEWFRMHANQYDRVIYHFGNSHFHQHMFDLLDEIPGAVVLHDFFLSNLVEHMEFQGLKPDSLAINLYRSHGYKALQERFLPQNSASLAWKYPCNYDVLQNARGIIVHSEYPLQLAKQWYHLLETPNWAVIPLLRVPRHEMDRVSARKALNLKENDFVICSFGHLGPIKLNHRLLTAWVNSELAHKPNVILVFVGENPQGEYGSRLTEVIEKSGLRNQIRITGWVDATTRDFYLMAADAAVQLRAHSRGETSAAVLDCMSFGLPTIVNAHGSLAELPTDTVHMLSDEFDDNQLINALEMLWQDETKRTLLGNQAREIILTNHNPRSCADQYFSAIERFYRESSVDSHSVIRAITQLEQVPSDPKDLMLLSEAIAKTIPPRIKQKQLLIDVSELIQRDNKSGIQRVVRNILNQWLLDPPVGWRVEPVYATEKTGYCYAREFTLQFLNCPKAPLVDEPIEYATGDIFLGLDLQFEVIPAQRTFLQQLRQYGVQVLFLLYDMLPLQMPQNFPSTVVDAYQQWLDVVLEYDGVICISRSVADELNAWVKNHGPDRLRALRISWFHLGVDPGDFAYSLTDGSDDVLHQLNNRPTFLMVGTVEPRKGHAQTLTAFEQLWKDGEDVNLVIVGKPGWRVELLVERLRSHPELGNHLFWLESASDHYLQKIYTVSTCLIAASEGEGFGLPLIEAAQHQLPIIARDIPVFREVAGEYAFYFSGIASESLADTIRQWLDLWKAGKAPHSVGMPCLSWEESAQTLLDIIIDR